MTGPPVPNRFLRPVPASGVAGCAGLAGLLASVILLSRPVAAFLFASDGAHLAPKLEEVFEWAQLALGSLGLILAGAAARSRRLASWRLPIRFGDVAVLAGAVLFALGLAEGWLRLRGAREWGSFTRTPLGPSDMRREGELALRPGVYAQRVGSHFDPAYDRVVRVTINRYGLRGALPAIPKPAGRTRVVCLGGSTTFGYTVGDGEDWPTQLGRELGGGYEVVNAGRPGATTYRDFAYLRDHLLRLQPDVVMLYEGFNDLWRGVRRHAGDQPDYGIVDEDLPPNPEPLDRGEASPWPWRVSFLAYRAGLALDHRLSDPPSPWPEPPVGPRFRFDPAVVSIYERNLGAIIRLCRARGVRTVVATFAACDDPSLPGVEQELRLQYVAENVPQLDLATGQEGMDLYREVTRRVACTEGVPLVDLARTMTKDLRAYTDTIHFTPEGEALLARQLAEALPRVLRTPRDRPDRNPQG